MKSLNKTKEKRNERKEQVKKEELKRPTQSGSFPVKEGKIEIETLLKSLNKTKEKRKETKEDAKKKSEKTNSLWLRSSRGGKDRN